MNISEHSYEKNCFIVIEPVEEISKDLGILAKEAVQIDRQDISCPHLNTTKLVRTLTIQKGFISNSSFARLFIWVSHLQQLLLLVPALVPNKPPKKH